jgi:DNA-binding transcriptional LysR family regulator
LTSDLGLIGIHVENERFASHHLFEDELVFICSEDATLDEIVDISELAKHKFITRSDQSSTRIELERSMVEQGFDVGLLENVVESDNMNLIVKLVSSGVGISYLSKTIFECYRKTMPVKSFQIKGLNLSRSINLITNKRRTLSPAAEDFIKLLNSLKDQI